jgi:hypothetical protein
VIGSAITEITLIRSTVTVVILAAVVLVDVVAALGLLGLRRYS